MLHIVLLEISEMFDYSDSLLQVTLFISFVIASDFGLSIMSYLLLFFRKELDSGQQNFTI